MYILVATGDGEQIMRFCPSFHIVQLLHSGRSPQQACDEVMHHMTSSSDVIFEVGVIAVSFMVGDSFTNFYHLIL